MALNSNGGCSKCGHETWAELVLAADGDTPVHVEYFCAHCHSHHTTFLANTWSEPRGFEATAKEKKAMELARALSAAAPSAALN